MADKSYHYKGWNVVSITQDDTFALRYKAKAKRNLSVGFNGTEVDITIEVRGKNPENVDTRIRQVMSDYS